MHGILGFPSSCCHPFETQGLVNTGPSCWRLNGTDACKMLRASVQTQGHFPIGSELQGDKVISWDLAHSATKRTSLSLDHKIPRRYFSLSFPSCQCVFFLMQGNWCQLITAKEVRLLQLKQLVSLKQCNKSGVPFKKKSKGGKKQCLLDLLRGCWVLLALFEMAEKLAKATGYKLGLAGGQH